MKNKAMNLAFINGDILFEKTNNEYSLLPRPFLKALQVEILDWLDSLSSTNFYSEFGFELNFYKININLLTNSLINLLFNKLSKKNINK